MRKFFFVFHLFFIFLLCGLPGCAPDGGSQVSGTVHISESVSFRPLESDALFITARARGSSGPPLAVVKMLGVRFPVKYTIGQDDVMIPGAWFKGDVEIRVILRRSGFINIPTPADLAGRSEGTHPPGARDVDVELTREI